MANLDRTFHAGFGPPPHNTSHQPGGSDVVAGVVPGLHAASHAPGAADAITIVTPPVVVGNLTEQAAGGTLVDAGVAVNDAGIANTDVWTAQQIISDVTSRIAIALSNLDWKSSVIDVTNNPPGVFVAGDRYIVDTVPVGAWVGHGDDIATALDAATWSFETPEEGWAAWVRSSNVTAIFDGAVWTYLDTAFLLSHTHNGADSPQLLQANTHQTPDTDAATTSLHHTVGTSGTQAAAGNHIHDDRVPLLSNLVLPRKLATNITSVADNGGGKARFTSASHGLTNGEYVTIAGCVDITYNVTAAITYVTDNTFDITTVNYNATDTGTVQSLSSQRLQFQSLNGAGNIDYFRMYSKSVSATETALTIEKSTNGTTWTQAVQISDTGQILALDGTNALPALSFSQDPIAGIYRISTTSLGVAFEGVKRIELNKSDIRTNTLRALNTDARLSLVGNEIDGAEKISVKANTYLVGIANADYIVFQAAHQADTILNCKLGSIEAKKPFKMQSAAYVHGTLVDVAAYDILPTDLSIFVLHTATAPVAIQLMTADCVLDRYIKIKDKGLNAFTNNITISTEGGELIDGAATYTVASNGGAVALESDGSNWWIVAG